MGSEFSTLARQCTSPLPFQIPLHRVPRFGLAQDAPIPRVSAAAMIDSALSPRPICGRIWCISSLASYWNERLGAS